MLCPRNFAILGACLCAALAIGCASAPTPKETAQAVSDVGDLRAFVSNSNAPAPVKKELLAKADSVSDTVSRLGKSLAECRADVDDLEVYRALVFGFCAALALTALGLYLYFRSRRTT